MRTVYAVRASGPHAAPGAAALLTGLVLDWLESTYPYDTRAAGVAVRVVEEPAWTRVVIDEHIDASATSQISVTIATTTGRTGDELQFEARQALVPREVKVRRRAVPRPNPALLRLVRTVVDHLGARDAGVAVSSGAQIVATELDAQSVAALCDAPSRRLPVVVESPSAAGVRPFAAGRAAGPLAGLAHVAVVTDDKARRAFNEAWGEDLLPTGALVVVWPDKVPPRVVRGERLTEQGAKTSLLEVVDEIIAAAAESLPDLPRPRRPVVAAPAVTPLVAPVVVPAPSVVPPAAVPLPSVPLPSVPLPTVVESAASVDEASVGETVSLNELLGALDELSQAWDRVDDLQSALAKADAMLAEKQALVDTLVQDKVRLEIEQGRASQGLTAASAADAVSQAQVLCRHLRFVAMDRHLDELDAIDPSALLRDLVRLDGVARQWAAGDITDTSFALACRNVGLDYAPDISDTARREYAADYAITWQGQTVLAKAHLRRGKGAHLYRVHLYLDRPQRLVVVGHIGRHLRGKRG